MDVGDVPLVRDLDVATRMRRVRAVVAAAAALPLAACGGPGGDAYAQRSCEVAQLYVDGGCWNQLMCSPPRDAATRRAAVWYALASTTAELHDAVEQAPDQAGQIGAVLRWCGIDA